MYEEFSNLHTSLSHATTFGIRYPAGGKRISSFGATSSASLAGKKKGAQAPA